MVLVPADTCSSPSFICLGKSGRRSSLYQVQLLYTDVKKIQKSFQPTQIWRLRDNLGEPQQLGFGLDLKGFQSTVQFTDMQVWGRLKIARNICFIFAGSFFEAIWWNWHAVSLPGMILSPHKRNNILVKIENPHESSQSVSIQDGLIRGYGDAAGRCVSVGFYLNQVDFLIV